MILVTIETVEGQIFWNKKYVSGVSTLEELKDTIYKELTNTSSQIKGLVISCGGSIESSFNFDEDCWEDNGVNFLELIANDRPIINTQPMNLQVLAKKTRDSEVSSDLVIPSLDNASFQCSSEAKDIKGVITEAISIGAADEDTILFRLSDNSWKEVSFTKLKEVLVAFTLRKKLIWTQFAEWDLGDKSVEFSVNYGNTPVTLEDPIVGTVTEDVLADEVAAEEILHGEEVITPVVEDPIVETLATAEEIISQTPEEVIVEVVG